MDKARSSALPTPGVPYYGGMGNLPGTSRRLPSIVTGMFQTAAGMALYVWAGAAVRDGRGVSFDNRFGAAYNRVCVIGGGLFISGFVPFFWNRK